MKKVTILLLVSILLCAMTLSAQVNFTANDVIAPYEGYYHPGINPGYYGGNWDDNTLADIAVGNETGSIPGIGIKSLRGALPEGIGQTFTYDIWVDKYDYNHALGTSDNLLFLGFASDAHKDTIDYCPSDEFETDMFANLYEPIWDNGENGTPVNDENYYALYVYEVVSRLKDKVRFWEIWNEPGFDFTGATGYLPPGSPGNWWENNPDPCDYKLRAPIFNYIRTLRISYEVIKSIDPDGYVCVAGLGYDSFLDALLRNTDNPDDGKVTAEYPLGAGAYFDVVGFHAYPHIDGSTRYWDVNINDFVYSRHSDASADALEVRRDARQEVLSAYGYDGVTYPRKEWIATEVNVPNRPVTQEMGSDALQRNYAMKVNMKAMQLDFTQLHLYVLGDWKAEAEANSEFDLMGFYESLSDIVPGQEVVKPAGIGLKTMSDALYETRYDEAKTAEMNLGENIGGGAYKHDDGTYTYALWAKTLTDLSEEASISYSFPQSFGLTAMIRKEWDHSMSGTRLAEGSGNIQLTSAPIFLRKLEEDQDIFLEVSCNVDVELQNTASTPEGGKVITWPVPTATTNCNIGVSVEQTQGIANGGFFPFGVHEIQYTITNGCGDKKYCAFNVKVASTGGGIGDCNLFRWEMGFIGQFNGNKYFVSAVKKDFAAAQAQAAGHGGYLVSIDSPEENEFLRQQVYALAFTGYNDVAQEGTLEWTSGKPVVYTNVADCQGCSNSDGGDVAMFNYFNGEWYFVGADAEEFFIMELPCAEVPPCICTTEHDPVCGPDGSTYSNACYAECDGVFDYTQGECGSECDIENKVWLDNRLLSYCNLWFCTPNFVATFEFENQTYVYQENSDTCQIPMAMYSNGGFILFDCEGETLCEWLGGPENYFTGCGVFPEFFVPNLDTIWSNTIDCMDCGCDAEYDPVCGPDGAEYSNSCIAECAGVFNYSSCLAPCDLTQQVWLQDTLASDLCADFCLGSIASFEFNDSTYLIFQPELCADYFTDVYNCAGTLICQDGGFAGLTECEVFFGANFTFDNLDTLWSSATCPALCALDNQQWLADKISNLNCDSGVGSLESFEYLNNFYVIEYDYPGVELDGGWRVYNCDGTLYCSENPFAGQTACSDFFGPMSNFVTTLLWTRENECDDCNCPSEYDPVCGSDGVTYTNSCFAECEGIFEYTLDECGQSCLTINPEWLVIYLSELDCNGCIASVESFVFNDSIYVVAFEDVNFCDDAGTTIYDCDGNQFCFEGGKLPGTPCTDYFGDYGSFDSEVLWSKDSLCTDTCNLDEQEWLADLLALEDLCSACIASIEVAEFEGITYIGVIGDDELCSDPQTVVYTCDGTIFCTEGGLAGSTECSEFFDEDFDPEITVLWSREEECDDCLIEDQEWVIPYLENIDCTGPVESVFIVENNGIQYILEIESPLLFPAIDYPTAALTIYNCDGSVLCIDGGEFGGLDCTILLEDNPIDALLDTLWMRSAECEECLLDDQEWLDDLLQSPTLCEDCISSIDIYTVRDSSFVVVHGDEINCSDAETTVFRCNGSTFCIDGGISGSTACSEFFYLAEPGEVLWDRDSACIDNAVASLEVQRLSLFPNPAASIVNISFESVNAISVEYIVTNVTGQEILRASFDGSTGGNSLSFSVDQFVDGIYFVQLVDRKTAAQQTLKFVVN